jgi:hypothetical protein
MKKARRVEVMLPENYILIHHAIHSSRKPVLVTLVVDGIPVELPIKTVGTGLRYVDFDGYRFMQQNPYKTSAYADRARAGEHITWGMCEGSWVLIDDRILSLHKNSQKIPLNTPTNLEATK